MRRLTGSLERLAFTECPNCEATAAIPLPGSTTLGRCTECGATFNAAGI